MAAYEFFLDQKDIVFTNGKTVIEALENAYEKYVTITGIDWLNENK